MENKKVIVFDMDETLEHGTFEDIGDIMTLRPRIDTIIQKMKECKELGIEIYIK